MQEKKADMIRKTAANLRTSLTIAYTILSKGPMDSFDIICTATLNHNNPNTTLDSTSLSIPDATNWTK